jgi:hypothetical protein
MTHFYVIQIGTCPDCGKPATHAVHTSGSNKIGTFCKKHAEQRAKQYNNEEAARRKLEEKP